jgi:hypothetical protein
LGGLGSGVAALRGWVTAAGELLPASESAPPEASPIEHDDIMAITDINADNNMILLNNPLSKIVLKIVRSNMFNPHILTYDKNICIIISLFYQMTRPLTYCRRLPV